MCALPLSKKGAAFYIKTFFPNAAAYLRHETVEDLHSQKPEVTEVIPGVKVVGGNAQLILAQAFLTVVSIPQKSERNTYNDFTYNDFTYNDFSYNDFTYNDFSYNDLTYNDFTYNDFTYNNNKFNIT